MQKNMRRWFGHDNKELNLREKARYLAFVLFYGLVKRRRDARDLALIAHSVYFDPRYYLDHNRDVAESGVDPVIHYLHHGADEKRNPSELFDTTYYVTQFGTSIEGAANPLLHFLRHNQHADSRRSGHKVAPKKLATASPKSRYSADSTARRPVESKYVIYTAIVGGYDEIAIPARRPPNCDFVAFSDHPLEIPGWRILPLNYLHRDPTRAARFVKLHPHLYFPEYSHSIWLDGNIGVRGDVGAFFDRLEGDTFIGAFAHPLRNCIYVEGVECIARRKDAHHVISRQLDRYREAGVPPSMGLWETNVLVRKHNDANCIKLMSHWWREVESGSRRDQLSLPVAVQAVGTTIALLDQPGICARRHPLLTFRSHRRKRATPERKATSVSLPLGQSPRKATTIGVCVHNGLDVVKACLASLAETREAQDWILIVDDASDAQTAGYLEQFAAEHDRTRLIRNTENIGYTRSANLALRSADTDWIVLLNSDTVVPPNALNKLIEVGERYPRLAIVGPLSNAASWQTVPRMIGTDGQFLVNKLPSGMTVGDMDLLCEQVSTNVVLFVPVVNGFCLAIRRSMLEQVGYFDEADFPIGYGEEDDLCIRAIDAGFVCGVATNAYVFHSKSASFTSGRRLLLAAAGKQVLEKKYSEERLVAISNQMLHHPGLRAMRRRMKTALQGWQEKRTLPALRRDAALFASSPSLSNRAGYDLPLKH